MQRVVDHPVILKEILIRLAKSSDGAKHFARAISVCKAFRSFVDNSETLRAVSFDCLEIDGCWELFQVVGGLACRCAKAGLEEAQFILGKILLKSTAQIMIAKSMSMDENKGSLPSTQDKDDNIPKEIIKVDLFLQSFLPNTTFPDFIGNHIDFVKIFLSRVKLVEFEEMQPCLSLYMNYFVFSNGWDFEKRREFIKTSISFLRRACHREYYEITSFLMVSAARELFPKFSQALQNSGLEKGELDGIELDLDDNAEITLVEKIDLVLKCFTAVQDVKNRLHERCEHSSNQKSEGALRILSVIEAFSFDSMRNLMIPMRLGLGFLESTTSEEIVSQIFTPYFFR